MSLTPVIVQTVLHQEWVRPQSDKLLVKRLILSAVAGALLVPPVAIAGDWRPGFGAYLQAQGQPVKKGPGPYQRGDRDKRAEHDKRHQGRLTDQERRDLHRDLDRANREIYRR
jgi:hypothetical protein